MDDVLLVVLTSVFLYSKTSIPYQYNIMNIIIILKFVGFLT